MNMPNARDPVRGETVTFDESKCHSVHKAEDADDLGDVVIKILGRSFDHDPVECCQGSYSLLIEEECPECGCNRAKKSVDTMAGITAVMCTACDYYIQDP